MHSNFSPNRSVTEHVNRILAKRRERLALTGGYSSSRLADSFSLQFESPTRPANSQITNTDAFAPAASLDIISDVAILLDRIRASRRARLSNSARETQLEIRFVPESLPDNKPARTEISTQTETTASDTAVAVQNGSVSFEHGSSVAPAPAPSDATPASIKHSAGEENRSSSPREFAQLVEEEQEHELVISEIADDERSELDANPEPCAETGTSNHQQEEHTHTKAESDDDDELLVSDSEDQLEEGGEHEESAAHAPAKLIHNLPNLSNTDTQARLDAKVEAEASTSDEEPCTPVQSARVTMHTPHFPQVPFHTPPHSTPPSARRHPTTRHKVHSVHRSQATQTPPGFGSPSSSPVPHRSVSVPVPSELVHPDFGWRLTGDRLHRFKAEISPSAKRLQELAKKKMEEVLVAEMLSQVRHDKTPVEAQLDASQAMPWAKSSYINRYPRQRQRPDYVPVYLRAPYQQS